MKQVQVAVGVIKREQQIFITKRAEHQHQGGKWEFPGGKVELGETVAQALYRELQEEVGIEVLACQPLCIVEHDYGDKQVKLEVFVVEQFNCEPRAQEGQRSQWTNINELEQLNFPEANKAIIAALLAL